MKIFVNFIVIFLFLELQSVVFCVEETIRTDYQIGSVVKGAKEIKKLIVQKAPPEDILGIFSQSIDKTVILDVGKKKITQIRLFELKEPKFKTGRAKNVDILKGGIGESHITLKITTEKGLGLSYKIIVYGK